MSIHYGRQTWRDRRIAPFALKVLPSGRAIAPKAIPLGYFDGPVGFVPSPGEDATVELTPTLDALCIRVREAKLRRAFAAINEAE